MAHPDLEARASELRSLRSPYVHARVVLAQRPTSAKPGDEALVLADGTIEGFVGGTCAESTVRSQGLALLDSGQSLLLRITPADDGEPDPPGRTTVVNTCLSGGTFEVFLQPVLPAPVVAVLGEGPVALALMSLGRALGYEPRPYDVTDVGGASAVVVASHGRDEEEALVAALRAGVGYVGLVASRRRGEAVLASLDVPEEDRARVRTPAGLDIGARTPEEIALSVLAEVVAARPRPGGRPVPVPRVSAEATTAVDPVCGMDVAAVESSLHLDLEGTRWWFCGSGCLRAFAADPAAYATATT